MKIQQNGFTNNDHFLSPSGSSLGIKEIVSELINFVSEDREASYRLVIGTDSQLRQVNSHSECDYVTAVVIHRKGRGARYFWSKERITGNIVLRDKIYKETLRSLEIAQLLVPQVRNVILDIDYDFEIHIDVGAVGPTREMIREVVGLVNGSGFIAKTKPDSWAASSVADKHT